MSQSPFQNVIVGVEQGGRSDEAVLLALSLRAQGASIELVHAVPVSAAPGESPDPLRLTSHGASALGAARGALRAHLEMLTASIGAGPELAQELAPEELDALLEVLPGHPAPVIVERARQRSADLIVLGAHLGGGPFDLGGTTRAVLAHAPQPVWIQARAPQPIRTILVGLDASAGSARALSLAARLASSWAARLVALHAFHGPEVQAQAESAGESGDRGHIEARRASMAENLRRQLQEEPALGAGGAAGSAELELVDGDPAEALLAAARDADLVVIGTHGATALSSVLLGRVAERVLRALSQDSAGAPVLAVREEERPWLMRAGEPG